MGTFLKPGGTLVIHEEGKEVDVTLQAMSYAMEECVFEPGVVFGDLIALAEKCSETLEAVFGMPVGGLCASVKYASPVDSKFDYVTVFYAIEAYSDEGETEALGMYMPVCDVVRKDGTHRMISFINPAVYIDLPLILGGVDMDLDGEKRDFETATFSLLGILYAVFDELNEWGEFKKTYGTEGIC